MNHIGAILDRSCQFTVDCAELLFSTSHVSIAVIQTLMSCQMPACIAHGQTEKGKIRAASGTCCQFLEWNRLSFFPNSFCACQFSSGGFGQPQFTGVGFAILQGMFSRKESLFSSSILMFGNRELFPAETSANGECFQYGPLGGAAEWQSHCDLLALLRRWELAEAAAGRDRLIPL